MQKFSCNEPATNPSATTISKSSKEASSPTQFLDPPNNFSTFEQESVHNSSNVTESS